MKLRSLAVMLAAAAIGALVVRASVHNALTETDPVQAARVWPSHPDSVFLSGLEEVGVAAARGRPIDRGLIDRMLAATRVAPLAPEPFLVRGVDAQLKGNEQLAGQAFAEARRRDPRSIPARYFLADHYVRAGEVRQGLDEIATLARLVPHSGVRMAPYLATFARMPGGARQVKPVLRDHPELEPVLLRTLSADAANADTILALWSGRGGPEAAGWQERLVRELVSAGQYDKAYSVWARFAGRSAQDALLDAPFDGRGAPPPFGWKLVSGPEGVAEATGEDQLHILHYGRADLTLAHRLLALPPGSYRVAMKVSGSPEAAERIGWSLACLPANSELAGSDLGQASGGTLVSQFNIPIGCAAQRLKLAAAAPEFPEQADVTISAFRIQRADAR